MPMYDCLAIRWLVFEKSACLCYLHQYFPVHYSDIIVLHFTSTGGLLEIYSHVNALLLLLVVIIINIDVQSCKRKHDLKKSSHMRASLIRDAIG